MRENRIGSIVMFSLSLLVMATAAAGGDEDYREGKAAYDRGDVVAAVELLDRAAEEGHVRALTLLGYVYDKSEENEAAVRYYQRAAALGDGEALLALGAMYANGEGVARDFAQAVRLMEQSADAGHGPAAVTLANAYRDGGLGLSVDRAAARHWLERGIESGYEPARLELERLLASEDAARR